MKLSSARFNLIVDSIYRNCQRNKIDQRDQRTLAKNCQVSPTTFIKVRNFLQTSKLLIVEGACRSQQCVWFPGKSQPNPVMLTDLYEKYSRFDGRGKVNEKKPGRISLESALRTLVQLGYTGVISKSKRSGYTTTTESIDLAKVEVGE